MRAYQPTQPPAEWQTDETREGYGLRILCACVANPQTIYACSDDQLAAAIHVSPIATAVVVTIAADKTRQVDYRTATADAVAEVKRSILRLQAGRLVAAAQLPPADSCRPADSSSGGSRVRLTPPQPTQPPAGDRLQLPDVDVRPVF